MSAFNKCQSAFQVFRVLILFCIAIWVCGEDKLFNVHDIYSIVLQIARIFRSTKHDSVQSRLVGSQFGVVLVGFSFDGGNGLLQSFDEKVVADDDCCFESDVLVVVNLYRFFPGSKLCLAICFSLVVRRMSQIPISIGKQCFRQLLAFDSLLRLHEQVGLILL